MTQLRKRKEIKMFKTGDTVKVVSYTGEVTQSTPKSVVGKMGVVVKAYKYCVDVKFKDETKWYINTIDLEPVSTKTNNFSPKVGDKVWYVSFIECDPYQVLWKNNKTDRWMLKKGLVKSTRQAARDRRKEIMEFLKESDK